MAKSAAKMVVAALLVLAVAAATAEARNIKTTAVAGKDDAVVQPQTFPPFDRLGGGMPGVGSSIPGFGSMPGGSTIPAFGGMPGSGSIGSMPLFGSPGLGGFGGMPGSPAAGSVAEHSKQP
ncbi:MFS18 protein-like [Phragmites australis]|uniref:MFS18 protein-like n=1 Tax=Phragmites australis TaxID=29695 RepID=UPI002D776CE8|nr:MFS18 protein-like [Phragmites australis]